MNRRYGPLRWALVVLVCVIALYVTGFMLLVLLRIWGVL